MTDILLAYGGIQMEWFSQLIGTLKLFVSTRIIIAIFLTSGFLLFFDKYISFLEEIIKTYKSYIAILFIFTGILIIVDIAISIIHYVSKNLTSYDLERWKIKRRIKSLNNHEKAILREFFIQESEKIKLPVNNPDVVGLIKKGILSSTGAYVRHLPVGVIKYVEISYKARELVNFKLIGWPESRPKKQELVSIWENRPQFIKVILAEKEHHSPFEEWLK